MLYKVPHNDIVPYSYDLAVEVKFWWSTITSGIEEEYVFVENSYS